ncbi:uncharacterized protein LOC144441416 [Glandiceps talaboti]
MDKKMMMPRPLMVAIAATSTLSILTFLVTWLWKSTKKEKPKFGKEIRDEEFLFGQDIIPCNHGSFGTTPRTVMLTRVRILREVERCPDEFFRKNSSMLYEEALICVADFVGANIEHLVFVENTTSGINCIMKSMKWRKGDSVLVSSLTYPAIKNTALDVSDNSEHGPNVVSLEIKLPILGKEEIVQQYRDILESEPTIKVAIIDHITSGTALLMPIKELIVVCHSKGVQVIVDGAHAPGQVQLKLEQLGADYYVGNLHKWVFAPRGCALLWVHPKHYKKVKPLVTSHCYQQSLQNQFFMQGTRDISTYLCAPAAIEFYNDIGGFEKISKYNKDLLQWAMNMLVQEWKTESLPIPDDMRAPFMGLVALPATSKKTFLTTAAEGASLDHLIKAIYEKSKVVCVILNIQDRLWCRISVQVYNTKSDFLKAKDVIFDML